MATLLFIVLNLSPHTHTLQLYASTSHILFLTSIKVNWISMRDYSLPVRLSRSTAVLCSESHAVIVMIIARWRYSQKIDRLHLLHHSYDR